MKNIKKIYEIVRDFLEAENVSLDDIKLYEEMIHTNKAYELGLDELTINKLHSLIMESYFYFNVNANMFIWARAMFDYYLDTKEELSSFLQNFNKWVLFEKVNEAMEG